MNKYWILCKLIIGVDFNGKNVYFQIKQKKEIFMSDKDDIQKTNEFCFE